MGNESNFDSRLRELEIGQAQFQVQQAQTNKTLDGISAQLEHIDHSISGNGKIGLNERMNKLEARNKWTDKLTWFVAGGILAVLGRLLAGLIIAVV